LIFAGPGIAQDATCTQPAELLDLYPTLVDLCKLPPREGLEGHSLKPQLQDASSKRPWPAITTHNTGNHGIRSQRWRYIHYADGSEELYDIQADPDELTNLAGRPESADVIREHRRWIPEVDVKPAPGSHSRILTYENGQPNWEGEDIEPGEPIPEI
jgi:arylsulfatase A-like enzyme